jgi:S1-C subfamily serine protease
MAPTNALQRTFRLQYRAGTATCFTIDVDSRQYIVTTRHALPGAGQNVTIQLQHEGQWNDLHCEVVGLAPDDVDIAVLAPPQAISPSHPLEPTTKDLYLSQDAYFLGFPFGIQAEVGGLNADFPLPLVKKVCVSLLAFDTGRCKYFLLDGHNNPGFSGGPVVYSQPGQLAAVRVAGVISGYKFVWDKVYIENQETELAVKYNTGIVIAYSIDYAVDLIRNRAIGAHV